MGDGEVTNDIWLVLLAQNARSLNADNRAPDGKTFNYDRRAPRKWNDDF